MDDDEEIDGTAIVVGDLVWWQRGEGVRGMYHLTVNAISMQMERSLKVGSSVLCGTVRAVGFEEPDFSYAVIATEPDGRTLQVQLNRLVKGVPPEPIPVSEESPENEVQPDADPDLSIVEDALP